MMNKCYLPWLLQIVKGWRNWTLLPDEHHLSPRGSGEFSSVASRVAWSTWWWCALHFTCSACGSSKTWCEMLYAAWPSNGKRCTVPSSATHCKLFGLLYYPIKLRKAFGLHKGHWHQNSMQEMHRVHNVEKSPLNVSFCCKTTFISNWIFAPKIIKESSSWVI